MSTLKVKKSINMALFQITVTNTSTSNGVKLEKGMSVKVNSKFSTNPLTTNGGHEVHDAFMSELGIDLKKHGGGGIANLAHKMEVVKIK